MGWRGAVFFVPFALAAFDEVVTDWDYHNFSHWDHIYPDCKLAFQSPINLEFPLSQLQSNISPLRFNYPPISSLTIDEIPTYSARVSNDDNGLTEQLIVPSGNVIPPGTWHFETAHFHWGPNASCGSEHSFNGQYFPLELHLIHRNPKYPTLDDAFKHADGLLVLGVMFELHTSNNSDLADLRLEELTVNTTSRTIIPNASLSWGNLLPPDAATNYATYKGSLTTPPCSEVVQWVLLRTPLHVSDYQLDLLRVIVPGNYRPIQPYNGRKVLYSWIDSPSPSSATLSTPTVLAFILFVIHSM